MNEEAVLRPVAAIVAFIGALNALASYLLGDLGEAAGWAVAVVWAFIYATDGVRR